MLTATDQRIKLNSYLLTENRSKGILLMAPSQILMKNGLGQTHALESLQI